MAPAVSVVYLSLGSNLGDRLVNLGAALGGLDRREDVAVKRISRVYETEPLGVVDQPAFLNLAAEIETALEPLELLNAVKELERVLGRVPTKRWGPRLIDIDIILWGARVVNTDTLTVPHAEFRRRAFVLAPLAELAAEVMDPVSGKAVAELAAGVDARGLVLCDDVRLLDRSAWSPLGTGTDAVTVQEKPKCP